MPPSIGAPRDRPVLEDPIPASLAVGSGYTEAKWVSEELVYAASRATPLDGLVVRVGQLCGGKGGAWATSEWFPCMVQSASRNGIGYFPDDDRVRTLVSSRPSLNEHADNVMAAAHRYPPLRALCRRTPRLSTRSARPPHPRCAYAHCPPRPPTSSALA